MLKRTLFFSVLTLCCTINDVASAADTLFSKLTHIRGQAHFERRSTIVPMTVCQDDKPCVKPEVYWTLLIVNREAGMQYELDEPFALGSPIPPEAIEISGVVIRHGTRVVVEGAVQPVTKDYAYLTEIKAIRIVVDEGGADSYAFHSAPAVVKAAHDLVDPFSAGWGCRTAPNPEGVSMHAQIWYSSPGNRVEGFRMRLFRKGLNGDGFRQLAAFEDLDVASERSNVMYRAQSEAGTAQLTISQVTQRIFDLPSELHLEQHGPRLTTRFRADMTCNRVRVF